MKNTEKTVGIYTLGCKVNQYESEAIAEELEKLGFDVVSPSGTCDAYVINTCTVTAESDRKARQFIRRAISKNPSAYIAVTGCLAQTSPSDIAKIQGVDLIVGNTKKLSVATSLSELFAKGQKNADPKIFTEDINDSTFEKMSITRFDRTRAYVKIEDGCENRCAYCIIPSARGRIRSKKPSDVLCEIEGLVKSGCREVVLTGIETTSYGKDLGCVTLADMLEEVDKIEGIGRVRLGSLDPSMINKSFVERISALHSIAPHFHLSLQSGSSRILALMKRKYNADQAMRAIELLRENMEGVQFTTDVIVGFPDETEEDFQQTCDFVKRARFLNVHVFPYSKRTGTLAAAMKGQIPEDVKRRRLHELEQIVDEVREDVLKKEILRNPCREVLFETYKDGVAQGHTSEFLEVAVNSPRPLHGIISEVDLMGTDGGVCYGELK